MTATLFAAGLAGVAGIGLCVLLAMLWRTRPRRAGHARSRPAVHRGAGRDRLDGSVDRPVRRHRPPRSWRAKRRANGRGKARANGRVNGGASGRDAGDVSRGAGWAVTAPSRSARVGAGLERFVLTRPKLFVLLTAVCCGAVGFAGGPVGAALGAIYAVPGAIAWRRRVARVRRDRIYEAMLEAIGNVTGDLRAGLVPEPLPALPTVEPNVDPAILMALARLTAAQRISEALGAPLADLMDRVDADLRGGHRLAMAVRAQTAGVQATAVILTGLPLMSIFLGAGMGVHPAHQLLHTRVGAGCVLSAALLQCGGLALTAAMVRAVIAEVRA